MCKHRRFTETISKPTLQIGMSSSTGWLAWYTIFVVLLTPALEETCRTIRSLEKAVLHRSWVLPRTKITIASSLRNGYETMRCLLPLLPLTILKWRSQLLSKTEKGAAVSLGQLRGMFSIGGMRTAAHPWSS